MELKNILLPLALLVAACTANVEIEQPIESPCGEYVTFGAQHDAGLEVKTVLKKDLSVEWETGDAITVFDDKQRGWTLSDIEVDKADSRNAVFSGLCNPASAYYYAVYPAASAVSLSADGKVTATLPSSQAVRPGSFASETNLAVAYTKEAGKNLEFQNVCGLLSITVRNNDITTIRLSAAEKNGGALCGQAVIVVDDDGLPAVRSITSAGAEVSLECDFEYGQTYYMTVFPGEYTDLTLTYTNVKGASVTYTSEDDLMVVRNTITDIAGMAVEGEKFLTDGEIYGYVNDAEGRPVSGVAVSDCYSVAVTDANGFYSLEADDDAEFVTVSVPSEYEIPYDTDGFPAIYKRLDTSDRQYDFTLKALPGGKEEKWRLCVLADPQTKNDRAVSYFTQYAANDIKAYTSGMENMYGVILGDHLFNSEETVWDKMKSALNYASTGVHFFSVIGNHDWYMGDNAAPTSATFKKYFGPLNYSWNRGNAHIVCMNNVKPDGTADADNYSAGFSDEDVSWLEADLAAVDKSATLIFCTHIALTTCKNDKNYDRVRTLIGQFGSVTNLAGHSHYSVYRFHNDHGGTMIREVVHPAACGSFWYNKLCSDGSPAGYSVYEFDQDNAGVMSKYGYSNMVYKSIGQQDTYQMRLYDASKNIPGSTQGFLTGGPYLNPYTWGMPKGYIVANVFHASANANFKWYPYVYIDGVKVGQMKHLKADVETVGTVTIPSNNKISSLTAGEPAGNNRDWWAWNQLIEFRTGIYDCVYDKTYWSGRHDNAHYQITCNHLFYFDTGLTEGIEGKNIEVRVTDPFGNEYASSTFASMTGENSAEVWFTN